MKSQRIPRISKNLFVFLAVAALLAACAPAMAPAREESQFLEGLPPAPAATMMVAEAEKAFAGDSIAESPASVERIVIKNANISIVVDDPGGSMDRISRMAEQMGGFVVTANLYQTELEGGIQVWRASITIRVPAGRLNDALEQIKAESQQEPLSETLSSQDVTSEYTDLQSRLKNLESAEEQLNRIMESAVKTEDVLNVFNQLVQVREQIEVIKGQIQYYEQSAAMSAISIELIPNEAVQPLTIGGWQPVGVVRDAVQGLINTLKVLYEIVVRLVINVLPVLALLYLIFILPIMALFRAWRRRRAQRKEEAKSQKPAE